MLKFDKIGLEIEGAWNDLSRVAPFFKQDGSVRVNGYAYGNDIRNMSVQWNDLPIDEQTRLFDSLKGKALSGEVASPTFKKKKDANDWIRQNYPDKTDSSCGLHIHISFDTLLPYACMMTVGFHEFLMRAINKFGDAHPDKIGAGDSDNYWYRFLGGSSYAQKRYSPLGSFGYADKYSMMNYGSFTHYSLRRTLELRAFPAFDNKETAVKALDCFLKTIEEYLEFLVDKESNEVQNSLTILRRLVGANEPLALT